MANPKPSVPPMAEEEDSSSPPPHCKRPFLFRSIQPTQPTATGRFKAKSKARSKTNSTPSGPPPKQTDNDGKNDNSDGETPQDGRGDPNLSGIAPPHPMTLVEPQLQLHDTGFHVITAGIEVGITTVKYVYSFPLAGVFSRFSRGIADSRLVCQNPSTHTFSTWKQAKSYYTVCFNDGSVTIRAPLQNQTPTQSPVRKKRKVNLKLLEREPPSQPPFSPAFSTPKAKGSASQPINVSSTDSTPASHSTRAYTPLFFPESPQISSKPANGRKRPHAGFQDIHHQTHNSANRSRDYPESAGVLAIPRNTPNVASPSGQYPEPRIPGEESLTPSPPYPQRSLGHIDPRYVSVESSSDEGAATDSNDNSAAATPPGPSSSLRVEVHSDVPATFRAGSPIIIISDSEDEDEEPEREKLWPHPSDTDTINKLNELFGPSRFA